MYIQAAIEKRSNYIAEIIDPVVTDIDYPEFETMLRKYPLDLVGISAYTHSLPDVQQTINLVERSIPMLVSYWVDHIAQCFLSTPWRWL